MYGIIQAQSFVQRHLKPTQPSYQKNVGRFRLQLRPDDLKVTLTWQIHPI